MEWSRHQREELARALEAEVRGAVRFADPDRALYSTDASLYQVIPIGVVVPVDAEDAVRAIRICLQAGAPVLPRGAGTSLAGQAVGNAVVIDLSKRVDRILSIDPESRTARVEPGVIQSHLNREAGRVKLMFGPDTATANRATLGGMIGNNSAGSHSILYGKTVDHVEEIDVVLSDGTTTTLGEVPLPPEAELSGKTDLVSGVLRLVHRVRRELKDEIRARYPSIMRRVSGYNLDAVLEGDRVNLAKLVVGSEGSLATVLGAKVRLVDAPPKKGLALVHFADLHPAIEATTALLETGPSAVELMDDLLLSLAAAHPSFKPKLWFMREGVKAVQMVEYFAADQAELDEKFARMQAVLERTGLSLGWVRAERDPQVVDAWAIRKAGLPLLASIPTRRKPLPFVEDTAVDPAKLPEFVRRFKAIVEGHGTQAAYYAHASAGCLHIRPLLDLHDVDDRKRLEAIAEEIFALVMEFGGSMSGEHGDGRARSHFNSRLFGPRVYEGFRWLKTAFDPRNLLNPGQVVDGPSMHEDLRWDFTDHLSPPAEILSWSAEGGVAAAAEACNGTAACVKIGEGTMCPSYMAVRREEHSTRGRANLLRSALSGAMPRHELFGEDMAEAMDLCLSCKACKSECPVKVDMAKLKAEWLGWRNREQGTPLAASLLAQAPRLLDLASWVPGIANFMGRSWVGRQGASLALGFDPRRPLPTLSTRSLASILRRRPPSPATAPNGTVALFVDTFTRYQSPELALDAIRVLEAGGHRVVIPETVCCGRPALGQGDLEAARAAARRNLEVLAPLIAEGAWVVGLEPGCLSMLWDDYSALVPGDATKALAGRTRLLEEAVAALADQGKAPAFKPIPGRVALHLHCHQQALGKGPATRKALSLIPELEVETPGAGCCGMAGDFGFVHFDVSRAIWEATSASRETGNLCLPGSSCRKQASDLGSARVLAPATLLAMGLTGGTLGGASRATGSPPAGPPETPGASRLAV